jgi:hypothetical protein
MISARGGGGGGGATTTGVSWQQAPRKIIPGMNNVLNTDDDVSGFIFTSFFCFLFRK